ncbi:ABC transporter substrate-binding protein [Microbacterium lushaniae]|nr:ABC transporter substrate-binding protein [Microbacterium lushaniae]KAA9150963.1 ABC transporter substrate-binding protein [Microbacterium lushaniae]
MKTQRLLRAGIGIAAVTSLTLLAGCSGGDDSATGSNSGVAPEGETTTIQFWHSMSGTNGESIDAVVESFNASQDEVEVVATFQGSYPETLTKLQQSIPAGTGPDISMIERAFVPLLAEAKVLADLNPFLESSDMSEDTFVEGLMGNITFDGELNAIPFNRSSPMLHVNQTALDELGLEVPTTWEETEAVANALVVKNGSETTRYGITMNYESWWPISLIVQQGGSFFNEDGTAIGFDEEGVEAFEFIKRMQDSGSLYYPPTTDSGNVVGQMFLGGQVGMVVNSSGSIGGYLQNATFDYQTAFLPEGERAAAPTGGANLVMLADSDKQDPAWTFLEWLINDPEGGQRFIKDTGYVPFTPAIAESDEFVELFEAEPQRKVAYDQLANSIDTNNSPHFAEIDQEFLKTIQAIMYDDADIETSLDAFIERANAILAD